MNLTDEPITAIPKSEYLIYALVGFVGGLARYIDEVINKKKPFSGVELIMQALVSGFFGHMGGLTLIVLGHQDWAFVGAGIVGFMGSQASGLIIKLVKTKLGINE